MARILVVAEELDSVSWTFAKSLHQQRQDVLVVTSKDIKIDEVPSFPILTPFSKWSFLEAAKLVPSLLSWNPDVVHFFFTHEDERARPAHWLLSAVASALPQKTLAASFFVDGKAFGLREKSFIKMLDLSTFGTRSQLMRMKRKKILPPHAVAEVLPPLEDHELNAEHGIRPSLQNLVGTLGKFVLIQDPPPQNLDTNFFAEHGFEVLILGDRFKTRSNYYRSGHLNPTERDYVFSKASALMLAECELSVLELRRFQELCEKAGLPMIVTGYQNESLPGLCRNERSGWVLEHGIPSLEKLLTSNAELKLNQDFAAIPKHELVDNTLNELLRLYQRAFLTRWT